MTLTLFLIVGCCLGYLFISGAWNPFKNEEVSQEAMDDYQQSKLYQQIYIKMFIKKLLKMGQMILLIIIKKMVLLLMALK